MLTAVTSTKLEVHGSSLLLSLRSCFHIHLISKNVANKTTAKAALTQMLDVINQRMEVRSLRTSSSRDNLKIIVEPEEERGVDVAPPSDPAVDSELLKEQDPSAEAETGDSSAPPAESVPKEGSWSSSEGLPSFPSVFHRDSYLAFRALCRLSMRGLHDEADAAVSSDSIALKNK